VPEGGCDDGFAEKTAIFAWAALSYSPDDRNDSSCAKHQVTTNPTCPVQRHPERLRRRLCEDGMIKINVNLTLIGDDIFDNVKFVDAIRA
jgi:hypothetical protein